MTEEKPSEIIKLKVMESLQEDAYKGIAKINTSTMRSLGVKPGDVITIKGGKETVAIVDRAYPADVGEAIIRIDGIIRRNAKTGIGEIVSVSKADVKEAKKITIAPAQKGIRIQADPDLFRRGLLGRAVVTGDIVVLGGTQRRRDLMADSFEDLFDIFGEAFNINFGQFGTTRFLIVNTNPKQPVIITENTDFVLNPVAVDIQEERRVPDVTYEDIGGLNEEITRIREMIEVPLKHPEIFNRLGIEPPKGVLLYGPPGSGKTLLAKAVANESEATFILLNGPEIMSKFYGESEKKIRDIFNEAEKNAPAIIFMDEIDAIAPKREDSYGEVERRVVSQLLTMMDGLKERGRVVVIGATNRPDAIDPALRRGGRFDREIAIGVPDKKGRLAILKIHTRNMPLAKDVNLEKYAELTHGFVGADIAALCKEAAMARLRKVIPEMKIKEDEPIPEEILNKLYITDKDFRSALAVVQPSAMREVYVESPNVKWSDIGGLEEVKKDLKEAVEWPLVHPEAFKNMGIKPPKGVLLYGPPGTGKTLLAKAVATESQANFIQIKGPELLSKWVGESEKGVRKIFERARQVAPSIIFFDEIDALASRRGTDVNKVTERVLNQMLAEMDGLVELDGVVVIAATNRPDLLDPALLRPGRFDRIVAVGMPDKASRLEILKVHTRNMPLAKDVNIEAIADKMDGLVGADIEGVCREAALLALRENINAKEVKKKHFEEALKKIKPSVSLDEIKQYKDMEVFLKRGRPDKMDMPGYMG
ncbi:MAG: CDC48 family AAA ATPase [Candidatus Pacearchaeota archaeon]